MSQIILLDAGPLGLASNPRSSPQTDACNQSIHNRLHSGAQVLVAEIADYKVRRELLRANKQPGLARLDTVIKFLGLVPVNRAVVLRAAELWAQARKLGKPTASDQSLDADVIIAAQASLLIEDGDAVTVATHNVNHLSRFVPAARWQDIS
jgi:predicted nucleic acid-binding protein